MQWSKVLEWKFIWLKCPLRPKYLLMPLMLIIYSAFVAESLQCVIWTCVLFALVNDVVRSHARANLNRCKFAFEHIPAVAKLKVIDLLNGKQTAKWMKKTFPYSFDAFNWENGWWTAW